MSDSCQIPSLAHDCVCVCVHAHREVWFLSSEKFGFEFYFSGNSAIGLLRASVCVVRPSHIHQAIAAEALYVAGCGNPRRDA